jgi:carbon monoxide dehydrogenase subunit G
MTAFTTSTRSTATVTASSDEVWAALTDPALLARFTPFLARVTEHGEHWVWEMTKVPVLGRSFSFSFTERMTFDPTTRLEFHHDPAAALAEESAGVEGWYALTPRANGTHLETSMEITVELPFPGITRPAVEAAMKGVVSLMGQRFSQNLLNHLKAHTA